MARSKEAISRLEADIELRIVDLVDDALRDVTPEMLVAAIRAAYGQGYCDALTEQTRGQLLSENGYKVPDRQNTTPGSEDT